MFFGTFCGMMPEELSLGEFSQIFRNLTIDTGIEW